MAEYKNVYEGKVVQISEKVALQVRLQEPKTLVVWGLYPVEGEGWCYSSPKNAKALKLSDVTVKQIDYLIAELEAVKAVVSKMKTTTTTKKVATGKGIQAVSLEEDEAEIVLENKKTNNNRKRK